jgi:hypothetical protein
VDTFGEAEVLAHWQRYLAETEAKFWSPQRFASTYHLWNGKKPQTEMLQDEPELDWR